MSRLSPNRFVWLLLAAAAFAVFLELGRMDVVSDNEGQRTAPPAEMLRSGDFVVPTINGETYLNKPPLLYWAIAGVYAATGRIDAFTARIPTALAGIALVLFAYLFLRRRIGEAAARWAALALLASPYVLQMMRLAELDIPLALATFAAVAAYHEAVQADTDARARVLAIAAGAALGIAIMLKGPVPFLFLLPAWIAVLVLRGSDPEGVLRAGWKWTLAAFALAVVLFALQFAGLRIGFPVALALFAGAWIVAAWRRAGPDRFRQTRLLLLAVAVGVLIAAPWALWVVRRFTWDYLSSLLFSQVTERTYVASAINSGDPLFFIRQLVVMLAPWGFLLPLHASRNLWARSPGFYRFALLAGWLSVGVFSLIAGKETEYVLPAVPLLLAGTGVHLAAFAEDALTGWPRRWIAAWTRVLLVVLPVLAVGGAVYAAIEEPYLGLLLEAALLAAVAVGAAIYAWRNPDRRLAAVFASALIVILTGLLLRAYHYTGYDSPKDLARLAGNLARAGHRVEAAKIYPAFAFYAETPILAETDPGAVLRNLRGDAPYYYVAREKFLAQAQSALGAKPPLILTAPYTNKDLVLIGNQPLPGGLTNTDSR